MKSLYTTDNRIDTLKQRSERCVCKYCGSNLQLRRIIFNDIKEARVEIFCEDCDRIEFGVEPEIYQNACSFVDNLEFNYYEGMSQNEQTRKMNIAKVCEIIAWTCKNMGLIDQNGFTIPVDTNLNKWSECMVIPSEEIEEEKSFEEYLEELI